MEKKSNETASTEKPAQLVVPANNAPMPSPVHPSTADVGTEFIVPEGKFEISTGESDKFRWDREETPNQGGDPTCGTCGKKMTTRQLLLCREHFTTRIGELEAKLASSEKLARRYRGLVTEWVQKGYGLANNPDGTGPLADFIATLGDEGAVQEVINSGIDLDELAATLRTQSNRCTAEPLFIVEKKRRIYGMDGDLIDDLDWVWNWEQDPDSYSTEDEIYEEIRTSFDEGYLNLEDDEIDPDEYGYQKLFYVEYWDFVCAHFTLRAAKLYEAQNSHNLGESRVYVHSQYRCYEWVAVRKYLMEFGR